MRKTIRAALAAAAVPALLLSSAAPASADATDAAAAAASLAADVAAAERSNLAQSAVDPNTTCQVKSAGNVIVQRTNYLVGEVFGQDVGTAVGQCVSFDTERYTATAQVTVEAFYNGIGWVAVCSGTTRGTSVSGVAQPLPAVAQCTYAGMDANLNKYHRARSVLTNTKGQTFEAISPLWFMTP